MTLGRLLAAYLIFAPFPIVARQSADAAPALCVLEGTAVDFATVEPLRKVKILLIPSNHNAPNQMAMTDESGHFRLENIPEGDYELTGERSGYLRSEFGARQPGGGGTPLRLKAGDQFTKLTLKLARCSIMTGKVLDENGEPMAKAVVYALRRDWVRGQQQYFVSQGVWTNDAGEYRIINLPPGRYYLCAEASSESFVEKQEGQEKRTVWNFYPGSRTLDDASPLELQSGQNLQGVNFQLRAEPVFHIRGKLVGKGLHDPENRVSLSAYPHHSGDGVVDLDSGGKGDGTFDFSGAPAGSYDLELLDENYQQTISRLTVEVKKTDVNGLVMSIPNQFELKGIVHRLDTARTALSQLRVVASDCNSPLMGHPYGTDVQPDGSFKIEHIWPGKYVFSLFGQGPGDYVKSVQLSGQEVLGIPIDLAGSTGPIEMTVSGGAGRINGSVQQTDVSPSVGGLQVVLIPEAPRLDASGVQLAKTDQNGHVAFENVTPGKYYTFAVTDLDYGLLENRSFMEQLRGNGIEVELAENGSLQVRIPIVPAEDVQRALNALGL